MCAGGSEGTVSGFQSLQLSQAWGACDLGKQEALCGCGPTRKWTPGAGVEDGTRTRVALLSWLLTS